MNHNNNNYDDIKIEIENILEDEGYWILNRHQNVPAIIKWVCPVCGTENIRDCRYESFESPPLGSNFIVTLICTNNSCKYVRAVELRINMILSLQNVLPQSIDEFEALKKYYESNKKDESYKQFSKMKRKQLGIQKVFLKRYTN